MAKRILVIPDIHGRTFWKESIKKYIDAVDRIVFLGDYLDPYEGESGLADDIFENFLQIVDLKRNNMEKVILLKGNHDQHYSSKIFEEFACGSRIDKHNWQKYHDFFNENRTVFQLAHLEEMNDIPYVFTHAGLTLYWLHKANTNVWHLPDNKVSIASLDIIERINLLDADEQGQDLLAIVGRYRSWLGEKTGSVLWADVEEHAIPDAHKAYGLDKVFQVFGHTKLNASCDKLEFDNFAMIDSQQCFIIDEDKKVKILSTKKYEENREGQEK